MRSAADVSATWLSALEALDRGGYGSAIARLDDDVPSADAAHRLWRAELFVYLDRLDEARAELETLAAVRGDLANRRELISAEMALWGGWHEEAAAAATVLVGDPTVGEPLRARALALVARCAVRRTAWRDALDAIVEPLGLCDRLGLRQLVGILQHCRAYAHMRLDEDKPAGVAFAKALDIFLELGDPRWEESCRALYGVWLFELGRFTDAEAEFGRAIEVATSLGIVRDVLWAQNNLANLLVSRFRDAEAVALLEHVLEWQKLGEYGPTEACALQTLAIACALAGDPRRARDAAAGASRIAELFNVPDLKLSARIWHAWARLRCGEADQVAELRRLRALARRSGVPQRAFQATLLYSDALVTLLPEEAARLWAEAWESPVRSTGDIHVRLVEFVQARLRGFPVRIGPQGELVFDVRNQNYPDIELAHQTLDRYLLAHALADSNGNRTEAGRRLGLTRSRAHDRFRTRLDGRPARDEYSAPDDWSWLLGEQHVEAVDEETETVKKGKAGRRRRHPAVAAGGAAAAPEGGRRREGARADGEHGDEERE